MSTSPPPRLSMVELGRVCPGAVPPYSRSAPASIVHLGLGAFARAHLGTYADELSRQGWPAMVRGVSLRSPSASLQLNPQDCLYTVSERESGGDPTPRVIGSIASSGTGSRCAIDAITDPATQLVTVTVTEHGYDVDERQSAPAAIAQGLQRRREAGGTALVIASLDNLLDNGVVLRQRVLDIAGESSPDLVQWISDQVRFPSSVVDRMVPATTTAELAEVAEQLQLLDLAAVTAERHRSWVITDCAGLPPLADVGVEVVADIDAFQRRKLWLLNAPHSALAYCGLLVGCDTIAEAATHEVVAGFVRALITEIIEVAELPPALMPSAYATAAVARFSNPALGHRCLQVGADGSRKLPQRLFPVIAARLTSGLPTERFAVVVAAWLASVAGVSLPDGRLPAVTDPAVDALRAAAATGDLNRFVATGLGDAAVPRFVAMVTMSLATLMRDGSAATLARS